MTELEEMLVNLGRTDEGKQGFNPQVAEIVADWLEEQGDTDRADCVRVIARTDFFAGVDVGYLEQHGELGQVDDENNPYGGWDCFMEVRYIIRANLARFAFRAFSLDLVSHNEDCGTWLRVSLSDWRTTQLPRSVVWSVDLTMPDEFTPGWAWIQSAAPHLPTVLFVAVLHVCGYTPHRLLACAAGVTSPA